MAFYLKCDIFADDPDDGPGPLGEKGELVVIKKAHGKWVRAGDLSERKRGKRVIRIPVYLPISDVHTDVIASEIEEQ
jgi:hypothetical protein